MSSLLTMALVVGILLLIVRRAAPSRGGHRYRATTDLSVLRFYDVGNGLLGPLVTTLLLLWTMLEGSPGLLTLSIFWGIGLGVLNRFELAWEAVLLAVAGAAVFVEVFRVLMFVLAPHEAGLLAILVKTGLVVLISASFLFGTVFSLVFGLRLGTRMLSLVVVLEILMLFAEPVFEVFLGDPSLGTLLWALVPFGVAGLVGFFSFPITLDLLSIGLAVALWSLVPEPPMVPVVGVVAGLVARAVVGRITRG